MTLIMNDQICQCSPSDKMHPISHSAEYQVDPREHTADIKARSRATGAFGDDTNRTTLIVVSKATAY